MTCAERYPVIGHVVDLVERADASVYVVVNCNIDRDVVQVERAASRVLVTG